MSNELFEDLFQKLRLIEKVYLHGMTTDIASVQERSGAYSHNTHTHTLNLMNTHMKIIPPMQGRTHARTILTR